MARHRGIRYCRQPPPILRFKRDPIFGTWRRRASEARTQELRRLCPLFADRATADASSYTRKIPVISYFSGSVSGLAPGAQVTMHGLKVGEVTDVRLSYDADKDIVVAPVRYEIEPERVVGVGVNVYKTAAEGVAALLKGGLRASLQSASLITGQQNVALDFVPDAPPAEVSMEGTDFVLPTTEGGGFGGLTASATELLNKVNTMPFDQIGKSLEGILKSVNDVAQGPQMKKALTELAGMIASARIWCRASTAASAPPPSSCPRSQPGSRKHWQTPINWCCRSTAAMATTPSSTGIWIGCWRRPTMRFARSARSPICWRAIPRR